MRSALSQQSATIWLVAAVLAILSVAEFVRLVPDRLMLTCVDSMYYLEGAKNIAAGRGYVREVAAFPKVETQPITHFPPLTSWSIAMLSKFAGGDCERGAWWLNLLCSVALVMLAYAIGLEASGGKWLVGLTAAIPLVAWAPLVRASSVLISEPLFFPLVLLGWLALNRYGGRQHLSDLAMAGLAFGLAAIVRYAGLVWCVSFPFAVTFLTRGFWPHRVLRAGLGLVVTMLPVGAVFVRNRLVADSAANRSFAVHLLSLDHLRNAARTFGEWTLPLRFQSVTTGALVGGMVVVALGLMLWPALQELRKARGDASAMSPPVRAAGIGAAMALSYLAFVLVTICFVHFNTPLDGRILSPMILCAVIALAGLVGGRALGQASGNPGLFGGAAMALFGVFFLWQGIGTARLLRQDHRLVFGYRSPRHAQDPLIQKLAASPTTTPIFSNAATLVSFVLGRQVWGLPTKIDGQSLRPNPHLAQQLADIRLGTAQTGGYVLYYSGGADGEGKGSEVGAPVDLAFIADLSSSELQKVLPLRVVESGPEATLYSLATASETHDRIDAHDIR